MTEQLSQVKSLFMQFLHKKLHTYPHDYYYNVLTQRYNDGLFYLELKKEIKARTPVHTKKTISLFNGIDICKVNIKKVTQKFGHHFYKVKSSFLPEITVMLYRVLLGSYKAKLTLHFYKQSLFCYTYSFARVGKKDSQRIIKILYDKYLTNDALDHKESFILDEAGNAICIIEGVELSFNYICGEQNGIFDMITNGLEEKKYEEECQHIKETKEIYNRL
ncbi:MAG: hypothetical protein AAF734_10455 [Bacteroidota bacterium]